jgi:hypothetical protein
MCFLHKPLLIRVAEEETPITMILTLLLILRSAIRLEETGAVGLWEGKVDLKEVSEGCTANKGNARKCFDVVLVVCSSYNIFTFHFLLFTFPFFLLLILCQTTPKKC